MIVKRVSQFVDILTREKTIDFAYWAHLFTYVRVSRLIWVFLLLVTLLLHSFDFMMDAL